MSWLQWGALAVIAIVVGIKIGKPLGKYLSKKLGGKKMKKEDIFGMKKEEEGVQSVSGMGVEIGKLIAEQVDAVHAGMLRDELAKNIKSLEERKSRVVNLKQDIMGVVDILKTGFFEMEYVESSLLRKINEIKGGKE